MPLGCRHCKHHLYRNDGHRNGDVPWLARYQVFRPANPGSVLLSDDAPFRHNPAPCEHWDRERHGAPRVWHPGAFVAGTNGTQYEITPLVPVSGLAAQATVPFVNTSFALCSGGFGSTSESTANISNTTSTVTVGLNLTGLTPNTKYSVQMYQTRGFGSCLISGSPQTVTTGASGSVSTTLMFPRIGLPPFGLPSTGASVFIYLPPSTVLLQTPSVALQ